MRWARLAAYVLVVSLAVFGQWRIEQVRLDDRAHDCMAAWSVRDGIRDAIARAANVPIDAALAVFPTTAPDRVAALRAAMTERIADALDDIPEPPCDLAGARRRLD